MKIRQSVELLLNLGNYQNLKIIGDVTLDSDSDMPLVYDAAKQYGIEVSSPASPAELTAVARRLVLESLQEQKQAIDELPTDTFNKK